MRSEFSANLALSQQPQRAAPSRLAATLGERSRHAARQHAQPVGRSGWVSVFFTLASFAGIGVILALGV